MTEPTKKSLLLVEDEALIALATRARLERYGYSVSTAGSGEAAIEAARSGAPLDLVLMDIDLGPGMDGTEAAAVILAEHELPVVFLSSHAEPEIVAKTEKITSYGYVVKNSNITVLDASIKMALKLFDARSKLMESEARFQDLFENMNDAFALHEVILDETGAAVDYRFVEANSEFATRVGLERGQLIGRTARELFPSTEQSWIDAFGRVATTGVAEQFTEYSTELNRHYETRLYSPRPGFCAGLFSDVTEQKRVENENRVLADVIRRSGDFIGLADLDTDAFFVNPAGQVMVGLEGDDAVRRTRIMDYFMPEDREFVEETILPTVMETGRWSGEFRFRHFKTNSPIPVYYDLFLTEDPSTRQPTNISTVTRDITEQKRMEEAYRAGEERRRSLVDHTNDAIIVHTLTPEGLPGPNVEVNAQASRMLGYTREELLNLSAGDVVPESAAGSIPEKVAELLANGRATFETENRRRDGSIVPVEVSAYLYSEDGRQFVVSIVRDVSMRKAAERELRQFRTITDHALFGCAIASVDGTLRYVNAAFAEAHGYQPEELIGRNLSVFHTEEQMQAVIAANETLRTTGTPTIVELGHVHRDGTEFPMLMSGITLKDDKGHPELFVVSGIDISDRKRHETALQEREAQFRGLLENAPDAVFIADRETGFILSANSAGCAMTGRTIDELTGLHHNNLHPQEIQDRTADNFSRHAHEREENASRTAIESEVVRRDGTIIPVEVKASHVMYQGRPSLMGIFRDISDRKESEQRINSLVAEKENLLNEGQHRIKNVMRTMAAMLALQTEATHDSSAVMSLKDAASRFQSIELLYDQLYRNESHGRGALKPFLTRLVDGVVEFFGGAALKVETSIVDVDLPEKTLSTVGLIVNELTTNAMKYAFNGRSGGTLTVRGEIADGMVVITVQDDGPGLSTDGAVPPAGGFGLTMVRAFVEQLRGTVVFQPTGGTTATVTFPLDTRRAAGEPGEMAYLS